MKFNLVFRGVAVSAAMTAGFVSNVGAQVVIESQSVAEVQEGEPIQGKSAIVMSASSSDGGPPVIQSMAFSGDGGTFEMAMPAFTPMVDTNNLSSLLSLPDVRAELEMVDDQFSEHKEAQAELQKEMQKQIDSMMSGGFDPAKAGGLKELIEKQRSQIESRVQEMLAPHQLERLEQIALRVRMKQAGAIGLLASKEVQEALEIDEEQLEKLTEKSKELKEKLEEKIAKLKKQAQEDLLDELSNKQQKKLEELLGSEFDYKPVSFEDRIKRLNPKRGQVQRIERDEKK